MGGATGGAVFGLLTQRYGVKPLTIGMLLLSTVMVTLFGRTPPDLQRLSFICAARRLLHQRRHRRPVRDHRAGVSHARPCVRHRLRHRRRDAAARCSRRSSPGSCSPPATRCQTVAVTMALGSLVAAGMLLLLRTRERPAYRRRRAAREHDGDPRGRPRAIAGRRLDEAQRESHPDHARRQPGPACRSPGAAAAATRQPGPARRYLDALQRATAGGRGPPGRGRPRHRQRRRVRQVELGELRARSPDRIRAAARTRWFEAVWLGRDRVRFREFMEAEFPARRDGRARPRLRRPDPRITGHESIRRNIRRPQGGAAGRRHRGRLPHRRRAREHRLRRGPTSTTPTSATTCSPSPRRCARSTSAIYQSGLVLQVDDAVLANMYDELVQQEPGALPRVGRAARRGAQPRAARHPGGSRPLSRLLRQLARAARRRRAARGHRGPGAAGTRRAPTRSRPPTCATSTSGGSGRRSSCRRARS